MDHRLSGRPILYMHWEDLLCMWKHVGEDVATSLPSATLSSVQQKW